MEVVTFIVILLFVLINNFSGDVCILPQQVSIFGGNLKQHAETTVYNTVQS